MGQRGEERELALGAERQAAHQDIGLAASASGRGGGAVGPRENVRFSRTLRSP